MPSPHEIKQYALGRARELGFAAAGVAPAVEAPDAAALRRWLDQGRHAGMPHMARHVEQRCDVRIEHPWARSVLCLAAGYVPAGGGEDGPVARYARGRDYHRVLKKRCHRLADDLRAFVGHEMRTRTCVDTAPILERSYARLAGLGWIGRNTCLIHPRWGSYVVLAEILLAAKLEPDAPVPDGCGDCRRCLDACPTGALVAEGVLDARLCINWATIEHRGPLDGQTPPLGGRVFGCDVCQAICPHNQAVPAGLDELADPGPLAGLDVLTVLTWSQRDWDRATRASTARRASWAMFVRNACLAAADRHLSQAVGALEHLVHCTDPTVASAARTALKRLTTSPPPPIGPKGP